jgi:hypothetical protein
MSASHSKELPGTVSELVGRRFRIVPGAAWSTVTSTITPSIRLTSACFPRAAGRLPCSLQLVRQRRVRWSHT